jgi:hypothetical protein
VLFVLAMSVAMRHNVINTVAVHNQLVMIGTPNSIERSFYMGGSIKVPLFSLN